MVMPSWWVQPGAEGHGHAITTDLVAKTGNEVRSLHWAVKLLPTILAACSFAIGFVFVPADALAMPQASFGALCVAILVFPTTLVATLLYLRECNGWRRSLLMGVVVGLVASTIIMMGVFLLGAFLEWLVSMTQFV
jgi:hypothetical protein